MAIYNGIDVSYAQGVIDWEKVKKSDVQFAIIRAGYGRLASQKDSQFERNYSECKKHGIPCGVYWYTYAETSAEALQEAEACLQVIKGKQFEYPIAFDIEEKDSLYRASELCKAFCNKIEENGYYSAIYSFKSALENNINEEIRKRYDVFLSHVDVIKSSYKGDYGIWQYSWTGRINGILGDVDLDYAYKDYPSIIKSNGLNGFKKSETESEKPETPEEPEIDTIKEILEHIKSIDKKIK